MLRWAAVASCSCLALLACGGGKASPDGGDDAASGRETAGGTCLGVRSAAPKFPASRDPDLLARAATVYGSCLADDGINRNLANMWHAELDHTFSWQRAVLQAPCLACAKTGCDALETCLGWEVTLDGPATCNLCEGSVASQCFKDDLGTIRMSQDCAAVGLLCDGLAGCVEAPVSTCTAPGSAPSCDATGRPQRCESVGNTAGTQAIVVGTSCPAAGLTCADGQCVGEGAACTGGEPGFEGQLSPLGFGCSGARLDACVGGKRHTFDCAAQGPGFSCQTFGTHFFCGLASACLPGNEPGGVSPDATCEGNTVVLCNAGRIDRVDCTSLGFTGCTVDKSKGQYGCVPGGAP